MLRVASSHVHRRALLRFGDIHPGTLSRHSRRFHGPTTLNGTKLRADGSNCISSSQARILYKQIYGVQSVQKPKREIIFSLRYSFSSFRYICYYFPKSEPRKKVAELYTKRATIFVARALFFLRDTFFSYCDTFFLHCATLFTCDIIFHYSVFCAQALLLGC